MESHLSLLVLFSLLMIMITAHARQTPKEYSQNLHVPGGSLVSPHPTKSSHCYTLVEAKNQRKSSNDEFESRPNVTVDDNGASIKNKKTPDEEFQPRSTFWIYENGQDLKGKNMFNEEFEPRPSVTAYKVFEPRPSLTAYKEFEPRPSVTAYKEFEPRPSVTAYKEFEPRPSVTAYKG